MTPSARAAERLLQDALLPALHAHLTGLEHGPEDNPGLLADLLALLQPDPDFSALGQALLAPQGQARLQALWPAMEARLPPRGHHHLALLHTRAAWRAWHHQDHPKATRLWSRALTSFGKALSDPDFLPELARDACAPQLSASLPSLLPAWLLEPHLHPLEEALPQLRPGGGEGLLAHWHVLRHGAELLQRGGASEELVRQVEQASARHRARLRQRALDHAQELARDVESTSATDAQLQAPFVFLQAAQQLMGPDEEVSIWATERAVAWIWPLYKTRTHEPTKKLLAVSRPFAEHVERLLLQQTGAFGRQSLCADFLLFEADYVEFEEEKRWFERALAVCPRHRNAHLMLSYHELRLAHRELSKCENNTGLAAYVQISGEPLREAWRRAQGHIEEAARLFPENPKLGDYRERLEKARHKLDP